VISDTIRAALIVAEALEACGVRYLVGGSLASAVSGEPRSTLDVDLVVELAEKDVDRFASALGDGFYVDVDSLRRAVRDRSSANVIHYATSTKVGLFVAGGSPLDKGQMDRRQRVQVSVDPDAWLYVYTSEDILLQKRGGTEWGTKPRIGSGVTPADTTDESSAEHVDTPSLLRHV
jgi:hypothetical protein